MCVCVCALRAFVGTIINIKIKKHGMNTKIISHVYIAFLSSKNIILKFGTPYTEYCVYP